MPTVSVIIPTHNRPEYLAEAIDSVLTQTYTDLEVIVVDDGSEHTTAETVSAYRDPRVRLLRQEKQGRSLARNRGIEAARSRFIAFLDDDDLFLPHRLRFQLDHFAAHPQTEAIACAARVVDDTGADQGTWAPWAEARELALPEFLYGYGLLPSSWLLRRECISRLDHWFDPAMENTEDTDFFIRLLYTGCRAQWLPEEVCVYRKHSQRPGWMDFPSLLIYQKILDRLFAQPDVPAAVLAEKPIIYAASHVRVACGAYALGIAKLARFHIEKALAHNPALAQGTASTVIRTVLEFARYHPRDERRRFVEFTFSNLPPCADSLAPCRATVLQALREEEAAQPPPA